MIDEPAALGELARRLAGCAAIALDTEADSLHAYPEKLCLLQISVAGEEREEPWLPRDALIDPLAPALREGGAPALEPLLAALRSRELLLHGADFDLRLLRRACDFVPRAVFDTMLAARLLGESRLGLKALLARHLDVEIVKGPRKANWARRPLDRRMIEYARDDTRYLVELAAILRAELSRQGRAAWHAEMCAALVEDCAQPREVDPERVWRIKGHNRLDRRGLAVLRAVWRWREDEALRCNRPPYFVVAHEQLISISLAASAGRRPNFGKLPARRREGLRLAAERACVLPPEERPRRLKPKASAPMSGEQQQRLAWFKKRRDAIAEELALDPSLVASKAALDRVARDPERGAETLMQWQRELLLDI